MNKKASATKEPTLKDVLSSINELSIKQDQSHKSLSTAIDDLAIATKNGFNRIDKSLNSFKSEMYEFKSETEVTLFNISSKLQTVDQRLDAIDKALGPLAATSIAMQNEIRSLNLRLEAVEHKIGMK